MDHTFDGMQHLLYFFIFRLIAFYLTGFLVVPSRRNLFYIVKTVVSVTSRVFTKKQK